MSKASKAMKPNGGKPRPSYTPPSSPVLECCESLVTLTVKDVKDLVYTVKEAILEHGVATSTASPNLVLSGGHVESKKTLNRASKQEYKMVNEVWDTASFRYKIDSSMSAPDLDELDEYAFVVRTRIDKKTEEATCFVDVKSEGLREIFRAVLQRVNGICLREDKPTVERNLLYHYIAEFEEYGKATDDTVLRTALYRKHLNLLVDHIKDAYTSIGGRVTSLLACGEITYDVLWALFKPNDIVYGTCLGTQKPRCVIFDSGEVKKLDDGTEYFHIEGRYLDFDGKNFGHASTALGIFKFRGTKRIDKLEAFPLKYHPNEKEVRRQLTDCGKKFLTLGGSHLRHYDGVAFIMERGKINRVSVSGRIMVDGQLFLETNPNYTKPRVDELRKSDSFDGLFIFDMLTADKIKANALGPSEMTENNLLTCSPTIPGFSFGTKKWLEFAVADIGIVTWNPEPFQRLAIPERQKRLIRAAAMSHANGDANSFDDFVEGKGRGLVMLLHGPPGVGKTLTAEALSEDLERPLYAVSSGQLPIDARLAEEQLSRVFRQAEHWKAVLLLDEADVFMRKRSLDHASNTHITMFLRMLEYYRGIMFLTTNRVNDFDPAMQSRIHLAIKYPPLNKETRRSLWTCFLEQDVQSVVNNKELNQLTEKKLNGRQIKNTVQLAFQWASYEKSSLTFVHIETVLEMSDEFECDLAGYGSIENLKSYT